MIICNKHLDCDDVDCPHHKSHTIIKSWPDFEQCDGKGVTCCVPCDGIYFETTVRCVDVNTVIKEHERQ